MVLRAAIEAQHLHYYALEARLAQFLARFYVEVSEKDREDEGVQDAAMQWKQHRKEQWNETLELQQHLPFPTRISDADSSLDTTSAASSSKRQRKWCEEVPTLTLQDLLQEPSDNAHICCPPAQQRDDHPHSACRCRTVFERDFVARNRPVLVDLRSHLSAHSLQQERHTQQPDSTTEDGIVHGDMPHYYNVLRRALQQMSSPSASAIEGDGDEDEEEIMSLSAIPYGADLFGHRQVHPTVCMILARCSGQYPSCVP